MTDVFNSGYSTGVSYTADPITPNDSTTFDPPYRSVDVTTGGTVKFVDGRGVTKTLTVASGYMIKCLVKKIFSTDTTATGFIGYP